MKLHDFSHFQSILGQKLVTFQSKNRFPPFRDKTQTTADKTVARIQPAGVR